MGVTLFIDSFLSNDFSQLTPLSGKIQPEDLQMRKGEWGMKKEKENGEKEIPRSALPCVECRAALNLT
jgi:hypothetical protein